MEEQDRILHGSEGISAGPESPAPSGTQSPKYLKSARRLKWFSFISFFIALGLVIFPLMGFLFSLIATLILLIQGLRLKNYEGIFVFIIIDILYLLHTNVFYNREFKLQVQRKG